MSTIYRKLNSLMTTDKSPLLDTSHSMVANIFPLATSAGGIGRRKPTSVTMTRLRLLLGRDSGDLKF